MVYNSLDEVPNEVKEKLGKYFTTVGGDTFVIHGLPPELTGGALARYSRAKSGIQLTLLNEFFDEHGEPSQEKGAALMDRVLNAFGDDSVGELEGTHVGLENVSQLFTKEIEDRRIGGSPIEQSTRYVLYDQKDAQGRWRYFRPKEIVTSEFSEKYEQVNNHAFKVYTHCVEKLKNYFAQELPREKFPIQVEREGKMLSAFEKDLSSEEERKAFRIAYNFTIRCAALDVGRCVLPSSTLTQLGVFGNGRFYTHLLSSLKGSELSEAQERGVLLENELNKVIPTYIKRNKADPRQRKINKDMKDIAEKLFAGIIPTAEKVTLLPRLNHLDETLASCLFPYTSVSLSQIFSVVQQLPEEKKTEILVAYRGDRQSRRDRTGRGVEAGYPLLFDLVGGFAEYRDLERHRMLTQQRQLLTTNLGFIMPPEISAVGLEKEVEDVVAEMEDLHGALRDVGLKEVAQYATLFNHRLRFMMGMNLREFQHLTELRSQPAGHFSYRSMVMDMAKAVQQRDPWTQYFLGFVDYTDPGNKISRAKEQAKIAGKNLAAGVESGIDLELQGNGES
ncbi:FAD-dependent thymidylate synthase [Candidatus Woesearchaeota archaeon]|nr:FAD-dependent thymidylate synthase [Candidatus Woesearchaeota archaeon]